MSTKSQNSRSFQRFLQDQQVHQHNKENRLNEFRAELAKTEASEISNRPEIDKLSRRICESRNYDKQELVERLSKKKVM